MLHQGHVDVVVTARDQKALVHSLGLILRCHHHMQRPVHVAYGLKPPSMGVVQRTPYYLLKRSKFLTTKTNLLSVTVAPYIYRFTYKILPFCA